MDAGLPLSGRIIFVMLLLCLLVASTLGLLLYLKVAPYWGLVDHPTDRGLHAEVTVVGAGVVPVAGHLFRRLLDGVQGLPSLSPWSKG